MAVETQTMPVMNGHAFDGDGDFEMANGIHSLRFTSGLILPPPEIKCKVPSIRVRYSAILTLKLVYLSLYSCHRQNRIIRCALCEPSPV
jgi:hypothetical protein